MNDNLARNYFTNTPVEFSVPKTAKVVFVADLFVKDHPGGAELTTEALVESSPCNSYRLHSSSLSPELFDRNRDKTWVFGNFTQVPAETLSEVVKSDAKWFVLEYDFKTCKYRSTYRHFLETGSKCDCAGTDHGELVKSLYLGARNVFWMSERQREVQSRAFPEFSGLGTVLSSVFSEHTLNLLSKIRNSTPKKKDTWAVLGSGSWIKGVEQSEVWCQHHKVPYQKIGNLPYEQFLRELATHRGLVFKPMDYDTCPRLVIEAKLLGLELKLNDNVLHKDDPWFTGTETESYLRSRPREFWRQVGLCRSEATTTTVERPRESPSAQ